jgi:hypothetical protein
VRDDEFRIPHGALVAVNSAISYQLSAISHQLSAISFQLSAFSYQPIT